MSDISTHHTNGTHHHPDLDMEVDLFVDTDTLVYIFHDVPFQKEVSWLEYDVETQKLDFIMDDGDIRNFGTTVSIDIKPFIEKSDAICIAQRDGLEIINHSAVPLIRHGE